MNFFFLDQLMVLLSSFDVNRFSPILISSVENYLFSEPPKMTKIVKKISTLLFFFSSSTSDFCFFSSKNFSAFQSVKNDNSKLQQSISVLYFSFIFLFSFLIKFFIFSMPQATFIDRLGRFPLQSMLFDGFV